MGKSVSVARIAGIEIRLDWSLLIIFALITFALATGVFPTWHPNWSAASVWLAALAAAALFLASILIHEMSHALVGRRFGGEVPRITLFVFGGMAQMEREPEGWKAEFWMAIVGPITSLVIGFGCLFLASLLGGIDEADLGNPQELLSGLGPVATILLWLGPINIILALFNLVPGFPLDGGRVLRAGLWGATGDRVKATRWATWCGQAFAWFLIASGFALLLGAQLPIFGSGTVNGLWLAFIGWFLHQAAVASYRQMTVQGSLNNVPVAKLMQTELTSVSPEQTVEQVIDNLLRSSQRCFPVVEQDKLVGLVCLEDLRRVASDKQNAPVVQAMTPRDRLSVTHPSEDAERAMAQLGKAQVNQLPVVENERLVGLLTRENLMRWLSIKREQQ